MEDYGTGEEDRNIDKALASLLITMRKTDALLKSI